MAISLESNLLFKYCLRSIRCASNAYVKRKEQVRYKYVISYNLKVISYSNPNFCKQLHCRKLARYGKIKKKKKSRFEKLR